MSETRKDFTDLIAKLEAATEGSRELDAEIGALEDPLGRRPHPAAAPGWLVGGDTDSPIEALAYTKSLDAARTLVPEGWKIWDVRQCDDSWWVHLEHCHPSAHAEGFAPIKEPRGFPLALCIAALKARLA